MSTSETMMGYSRIVFSLDCAVVLAHVRASDNLNYSARSFGFPELWGEPGPASPRTPAVATIRRAPKNEGVDDASHGWSSAAAAVRDRGRRFQAQRTGVLRTARHQRDVRPGLLPRGPPGRAQHPHARRARRLEWRRAARALARAVVADPEARQA